MVPRPDDLIGNLDDVVEEFDHVSIGVHDIAQALPLLNLLGASYLNGGDVPRNGFRWMQFRLPGQGKVELVQPLDPEDEEHFLVRFLRDRGQGVHHLTFRVRDLTHSVAEARARGFTVVGVDTDHDWKEAFIHPESSHGVLIQLAQWSKEEPQAPMSAVLAGEIETVA
jgi:methylmalonyl-CoA/ethylmalonyl-CoA epimerase